MNDDLEELNVIKLEKNPNENHEIKKYKYSCIKGIFLEIDEIEGLEEEYDNVLVYHSEQVPEGLFKECLDCEICQLGLSFDEPGDKIKLVKICSLKRNKEE